MNEKFCSTLFRISRSKIFFKTGIFKNFAILTVKHLRWILILIKLQAWRSAAWLKRDSNIGVKKRLQYRCLPVNIEKFLKNGFFYRKPPVAAFISTQKGKEKESVEQKEKKFFKWKKKKLKHFSWLLAASFGTSYNRIANTTISIPKLTLFLF